MLRCEMEMNIYALRKGPTSIISSAVQLIYAADKRKKPGEIVNKHILISCIVSKATVGS